MTCPCPHRTDCCYQGCPDVDDSDRADRLEGLGRELSALAGKRRQALLRCGARMREMRAERDALKAALEKVAYEYSALGYGLAQCFKGMEFRFELTELAQSWVAEEAKATIRNALGKGPGQ